MQRVRTKYEPNIKLIISFLGLTKAYFLRAKANAEVWNEVEAKKDFEKVVELDPTMTRQVKKEITKLEVRMEEKEEEDKLKYKNLFS